MRGLYVGALVWGLWRLWGGFGAGRKQTCLFCLFDLVLGREWVIVGLGHWQWGVELGGVAAEMGGQQAEAGDRGSWQKQVGLFLI